MRSATLSRLFSGIAAALLGVSALVLTSTVASADVPDPLIEAPFTAPNCAGETLFNPAENTGYAVTDLTEVFGERIDSYNAGHIVPLYDAFGGSILLEDDGTNTGESTYPPLCGTRYVESLGTSVSEWMFCTDRLAQTCGDTDAAGNLVDKDGNPINPMTGVASNPRLTSDQEKIIAYLVQHGHSYAGVGNQAWGNTVHAQSGLGSNERAALQTLIWCVSDPASDASDFATTCENNMGTAEQARILAMVPDTPELVLNLASPAATLEVNDVAEFTLTTNLFNQPLALATGGTADIDWSVCEGDAVLTPTAVTVTADNPTASINVVLCATATTAGTVTLDISATPPSTEHIGWSQSVNDSLAQPCQVYATFHEVIRASVSSHAEASFETASTPSTPQIPELADSGGPASSSSLWWGGALVLLGMIAVAFPAMRQGDRGA